MVWLGWCGIRMQAEAACTHACVCVCVCAAITCFTSYTTAYSMKPDTKKNLSYIKLVNMKG